MGITQELTGRTALVTGSTSGIGKATALALAAREARVLVVGRNEERGEATVHAIVAEGGKADFVRADLRDAASAKDLAQRALAVTGQVDILINNQGGAGRCPRRGAPPYRRWVRTRGISAFLLRWLRGIRPSSSPNRSE
jgi:NAD(P)-dependent dehydrogenase (short-subunit alcohol dehydrogenase family)